MKPYELPVIGFASQAIRRKLERRRDWIAQRLFRRIDRVQIVDAILRLNEPLIIAYRMTLEFRRCQIVYHPEQGPALIAEKMGTIEIAEGTSLRFLNPKPVPQNSSVHVLSPAILWDRWVAAPFRRPTS